MNAILEKSHHKSTFLVCLQFSKDYHSTCRYISLHYATGPKVIYDRCAPILFLIVPRGAKNVFVSTSHCVWNTQGRWDTLIGFEFAYYRELYDTRPLSSSRQPIIDRSVPKGSESKRSQSRSRGETRLSNIGIISHSALQSTLSVPHIFLSTRINQASIFYGIYNCESTHYGNRHCSQCRGVLYSHV